jgi:hypothetical protein
MKLYRLTWENPETKKMMATWWSADKAFVESDIKSVEEKYGVTPKLETKQA